MYAQIAVKGDLFLSKPSAESLLKYEFVQLEKGNSKYTHINLIKKNSIEGMISYLLGEKKPIKKLAYDSDRDKIMKNQLIIHVEDKPFKKKLEDNTYISSYGYIHFMSGRRDLVYKESSFKKYKNVNLINFSEEKFSEIILFLRNELKIITGETKLHKIFALFLEQYKSFDSEFKKFKAENDLSFFDKIDVCEKDLIEIPKESSNASKTLLKKINEEIKTLKSIKKSKKFPDKSSEIPLFPLHVALIKEIKKSLKRNKLDFSKLSSSKWSCFDTSLLTNAHWLDKDYVPIVSVAPAYVIKLNFSIYIKNLTQSQVKRFLNGPRIASWGEGGVAELTLSNDSPPWQAYKHHQDITCCTNYIYGKTKYYYRFKNE